MPCSHSNCLVCWLVESWKVCRKLENDREDTLLINLFWSQASRYQVPTLWWYSLSWLGSYKLLRRSKIPKWHQSIVLLSYSITKLFDDTTSPGRFQRVYHQYPNSKIPGISIESLFSYIIIITDFLRIQEYSPNCSFQIWIFIITHEHFLCITHVHFPF